MTIGYEKDNFYILSKYGKTRFPDKSKHYSGIYKVILERPVIGYKNVTHKGALDTYRTIAKLLFPIGTIIIKGKDYGHKLRASRAKVLSLTTIDGKKRVSSAYSRHDNSFVYREGKMVKPKNGFNPHYQTCAGGIHFFLSREKARAY